MRVKSIFSISFFLFLCIVECCAFDAKDIISPSSGIWGNVQPLILNVSDDSDLYYSLDSSDPLVSGMSYDEPFVIDRTGDVKLTITSLSSTGEREDFYINYKVVDSSPSLGEDCLNFISDIKKYPIKEYLSGDDFTVPEGLRYSFNGEYYIDAGIIKLSGKNSFDRYTSCKVTDGINFWSFVIEIEGVVNSDIEDYSSAELLPFYVDKWENLIFTSSYYIYQIDDNDWISSESVIKLDRNIDHVLRWQSVEYSPDNEIEEFYLEGRPYISKKIENGTITYFIDDDDFELSYKGIRSKNLTVDAFTGEDVRGIFDVGVFYKGLSQGNMSVSYAIDRIPPGTPIIASSSSDRYARDKVILNIKSDEDSTILYAVNDAYQSEIGFQDITAPLYDSLEVGDYTVYDGNDIVLKSYNDKACFYKVRAYSIDNSGNKSGETEYRVVVDEYNYYLMGDGVDYSSYFASEATANPDGSYTNPFTSFDQALEVINSNDYTRLHILGELTVKGGCKVIANSCMIIGSQSKILIANDSYIEIDDSCVTFEDFILEKKNSKEKESVSHTLFTIGNSDVSFTDCEIVGIFGHSGILYNVSSSSLKFADCGITMQTDEYGCVVSSVDTNLILQNSRVTTVSPNCVNLSIHDGDCDVQNSIFYLVGKIGRSLELVKSNARLENNTFKANIGTPKSSYLSAIWIDDDSCIEKDVNNIINGF